MHVCCVPTCDNASAPFHRFPISRKKVYKTWVERIACDKILNKDPSQVYNSHYICHKHFEDVCYVPNSKTAKLKVYAAPTLHLPGYTAQANQEDVFILPSHDEHICCKNVNREHYYFKKIANGTNVKGVNTKNTNKPLATTEAHAIQHVVTVGEEIKLEKRTAAGVRVGETNPNKPADEGQPTNDNAGTVNMPSPKKQKMDNAQGGSSWQVAIVTNGYPEIKMSKEQGKLLQTAILEEVWKCEPETGPQFTKSYVDQGMVFVTCANEASKSWLVEKVNTLQPWEGAILMAGIVSDIVPITKVAVWIPTDLLGTGAPKKILQLLKTQNVGLRTETWGIASSRTEGRGMRLVLALDDTALSELDKVGYKAYLGFTQLTFRVMGNKPNKPSV